MAGHRVNLAELIAVLTAKPLFVPGVLGSGGAALFHGRNQSSVNDEDVADRYLESLAGGIHQRNLVCRYPSSCTFGEIVDILVVWNANVRGFQ